MRGGSDGERGWGEGEQVTGTVMKGQWTLRQMQEAIEGGKAHCQRLDGELRATLREALLEPMDPG